MPSVTSSRRCQRAAVALSALLAVPAVAGDGVPSVGPLSDVDFYRAATCGAPSGGTCVGSVLRWGTAEIGVYLTPISDAFPPKIAALIEPALDNAVGQINAAGANIRLKLTKDENAAPIRIYATPTPIGEPMHGIPGIKDGDIIASAM